ncbi:hypothetical protein KIL84_016417 [Mauremys mutica]|uniref:Uncharacterized protein n=1 Tax=Mauremys mutica TaxID=74926 RepID=A0A9D3X4H4_9SAUR|nr:hypothetical protein KIL84_016417 [Mauremys mutica]
MQNGSGPDQVTQQSEEWTSGNRFQEALLYLGLITQQDANEDEDEEAVGTKEKVALEDLEEEEQVILYLYPEELAPQAPSNEPEKEPELKAVKPLSLAIFIDLLY